MNDVYSHKLFSLVIKMHKVMCRKYESCTSEAWGIFDSSDSIGLDLSKAVDFPTCLKSAPQTLQTVGEFWKTRDPTNGMKGGWLRVQT